MLNVFSPIKGRLFSTLSSEGLGFYIHSFTYPCIEACKISPNTAIIVCAIAVIASGNYRTMCYYEKHSPDTE